MTIFEKKRYIIKLVREWFPKTPIYFDEYLEADFAGLTQFNYNGCIMHFAFSEAELIRVPDEDIRDIVLHEVAHGLNGSVESDGHDDRWLKLFYAIGGKSCWGTLWLGYYSEIDRER